MQERAKFFSLDKEDGFREFREKYLRAADGLKKQGNGGIIEAGNFAIPMQKLLGYALDPQKAPDKAKAFELALGYNQSNAYELLQNILDNLDESKFLEKGDRGYGVCYECILQLIGANGRSANVLTAWIEDNGKKRLTSIYVTDKKVRK